MAKLIDMSDASPTPTVPEETFALAVNQLSDGNLRRVVVIEDNESAARLMSRILESRENCEVYVAPDGVSGMRAIREVHPDLVITDLMMPDVDGFGVIEQMKADPKLHRIPIVVVTAKETHDAGAPPTERANRDGAAKRLVHGRRTAGGCAGRAGRQAHLDRRHDARCRHERDDRRGEDREEARHRETVPVLLREPHRPRRQAGLPRTHHQGHGRRQSRPLLGDHGDGRFDAKPLMAGNPNYKVDDPFTVAKEEVRTLQA
ncbi:MAG: response regulator, partial [Nitrospiraceae bacterium]|nr:response regulator [Nitrospiraceae bacterium]